MEENMIRQLIETAIRMTERSYCPYSNFAVGAALLTTGGKIYTGCNIENAAFSPTVCAERTAVFKAVSEGEKDFRAIAVVGGPKGKDRVYSAPCGVCRQVLAEFTDAESFLVIIAVSEEDYRISTLAELLPAAFGPEMKTADI